MLSSARFLPLQWWQVQTGNALQVCLGQLRCPVLPLLDVIDRLRRCNPSSCLDAEDRRLNTLRVVLRKKPQMFTANFDFGPNSIRQHRPNLVDTWCRFLVKQNFLSTTSFSHRLEFADYNLRSTLQCSLQV